MIGQGLHGVLARKVHSHKFGLGLFGHRAGSSKRLAPCLCSFKSSGAALTNHCPFELSEGAQHVAEHATRWAAGVDGFREAAKRDATLLQGFQQTEKIAQAAGQAVELVDHKNITRAQASKEALQLRALRDAAALFLHNVFDSCAFECRELDGGVLLGGRNARVAVGGQRSTYWPSKRFREIMYSLAHAVVPGSILQFGEGW